MPEETIRRILDIEKQADVRLQDARQRADAITARAKEEAEAAQRAILADAHRQIEALTTQAEHDAAQTREQILAEAAAKTDRWSETATAHHEQAVSAVLDRLADV